MCGIVGYVSLKEKDYLPQKEHFLRYALALGTLRGDDSTGIMSYYEDGEIKTTKTIHPGNQFVQTKEFSAAKKEGFATIGHNRAATMGAISIENTHPFSYGDISLVHNGVLHMGGRTLPSYEEGFAVDSMQIALGLSKSTPDKAKEFLETLDGDFALVWFDRRNETINMCRTRSRPLHITINQKKDCIFIMSDGDHLNVINKSLRGDVVAGNSIWSIDPYKLLTFKSGTLVPDVTEFSAYTRPEIKYNYNNWNNDWRRRSFGNASNFNHTQDRHNKNTSTNKPHEKYTDQLVNGASARIDAQGKNLREKPSMAHLKCLQDFKAAGLQDILIFKPKIVLEISKYLRTVIGTVTIDSMSWTAIIHKVPSIICNTYLERVWAVSPVGVGFAWGSLKEDGVSIICNYIDWNVYAVLTLDNQTKKQKKKETTQEAQDQMAEIDDEETVAQAVKNSLILDCAGNFTNRQRFQAIIDRGCINCGGVLLLENKNLYKMVNNSTDIACSICAEENGI